MDLAGRQIVLGVSGSVAAYKAVYLTRLLIEAGADVWPILTQSATRFVGPLSFSALCKRPVVTNLWSAAEAGEVGHVELAHRADVLLLAPCTADLIARLHAGRADDPLSAVALSTDAPWVLAPAMETGMWENPITQRNLRGLVKDRGAVVVQPDEGELASGRVGTGRLAEPESILNTVRHTLAPKDLAGERVLVTAGPTREALDPVRFLTNRSSGKMGYAVARAAQARGAEVCLVSGPTELDDPFGVCVTRVETVEDMLNACQKELDSSTVLIMAAAPADYRPASFSVRKLKKADSQGGMRVDLVNTPDILKTLNPRSETRIVVGFAAETHRLLTHAKEKLVRKNLDLIVANDITVPGAGFGVDTNQVTLLERGGRQTELAAASKTAIAHEILNRVKELRNSRVSDLEQREPLVS